MTEIATTRDVSATPAEVWALLADFGSLATWALSVDHSCLTTEQTEGVGTARRVQVGRNVLIESVTRWEPGAVLSYDLAGLPGVVRSATNTWTIAPSSAGTTVTLATAVDCGPLPPQRLLARVVARKMAETSGELIDALVRHLEETP